MGDMLNAIIPAESGLFASIILQGMFDAIPEKLPAFKVTGRMSVSVFAAKMLRVVIVGKITEKIKRFIIIVDYVLVHYSVWRVLSRAVYG